MKQETWTAVDGYVIDTFALDDEILAAVQKECDDAGLPPIQVSAAQGKYLELVQRMTGAQRVLEIGTLGGYSTIWMARGLPASGRVVTMEIDPKHAEVARRNFVRAGVSDSIDLRVGPALESLPVVEREGLGPFDFIFIDADKANIPAYFEWALRLSRAGSVIIVDNPSLPIFLQSANPDVQTTVLQTVGMKGYDGFAVSVVAPRQ